MVKQLKYKISMLLIIVSLIISFVHTFAQTSESVENPGKWDWGHLRIVRSNENIEFLNRLHATVNQNGGPIIFPKDKETDSYITDLAEFNKLLDAAKEKVKRFHDEGMFVIAYTTMALAGESPTFDDLPNPEEISLNKAYNTPGLWETYQAYFGPKPEEGPDKWARHTYDKQYSYYRFRHPNAPKTGGRFEMFGCQDNPSYVQYFKGVIRLVAASGHDGAYIDWTKVHEGTCYCKHSVIAFKKYLRENVSADFLKKRYGITDISQIEPPLDNTMALWREWLRFRSWSLTEFQKAIRAEARKINPNFLLSGNINGGAYGNMAYTNGDDMEMMGVVEDFLYSEIQEGLNSVPRVEGETKICNSGPLKFLAASAMQKPVWMYCIQPSTPKPIPNENALFNLIKLNIAEAFANHNTFSVVRETFGEPISPKVHNGAEQIYAFFKENEQNLIGAKLAANTAIFCSINQFYSDEFSYFNPASRVLADNGIAHVMTVERDFSASELAKYKTLILPYVPLMSDAQIKIISEFVQNGGGLVVMGLSSLKDENGLPRRNIGLSDLLGFNLQNAPVIVTRKEIGKGRVVFIPMNPIPVGRGDTENTPLPDDHMMYGQGKFPDGIKDAFAALAEAVEWAADNKLSGKLLAPYTVEMTTMEQKEKNLQLVHLVNYQVTLDGVVTPAENARVRLLIPENKKISRLTIGSPINNTTTIDYEVKENYIEFAVPSFEIYSLATVYFE
jgi:hypothetical protein